MTLQNAATKLLSGLSLLAVLSGFTPAQAQQAVTLLAPGGMRAPIQALAPGFEAKTGYKLNLTFIPGLAVAKRVTSGDAADVLVVQSPFPEVLASGNVDVKTQTPLASVAVAVAVKAGAPKPDISTPEKVKATLLAAESVAYPDPAIGAAASISFDKMLIQLGIADQIKPKLIRARNGAATVEMVGKGEVEVAITFISEMHDPGATIVGALPADICPPTALVGFVSAHPANAAGAKALLAYLASPEAMKVYEAQSMQPGG